ncbi:nucleoside-diphosphate kinase [Patescibacteria group bacterium]|nr:nucleoside-diphosphate kinase [Patescibacteria group bacterium]
MDQERSFVMVKPDGVKRGLSDEIIKRLTDAGLSIVTRKDMQPTRELAYQHYADSDEWYLSVGTKTIGSYAKQGLAITDVFSADDPIVVGKQVREWLADFLTSGPVVAMIISGPIGTVQKIRDLVGATSPEFADKGTIRGDLGDDTYYKSNSSGRAFENLVHASESVVEAEREIKLWFPELG